MQRRARLGLIAAAVLVTGLQGAANPAGPAGFVGRYSWKIENPLFGGFSAIDLSEDGGRFVALSDRGSWTEGTVRRDAAGQIIEIDAISPEKLKAQDDAPLKSNRADSEGLALAADGALYVSFEGVARILRYSAFGSSAENLPRPPEFRDMPRNAALEALAVDAAGRLYTLPEDTRQGTDPFPVFRYDPANGWSQPFLLPRDGTFLPVGADFGPDGQLYVLERQFRGLGGFASRVRAVDPASQGIAQTRTVLETAPGQYGNLEGLAVWRDAAGDLRLTLIADDNFLFLLSTEIVEYRLHR